MRHLLRQEGVYDAGIFKAIFMAGGPGSGKSYIAQQTTAGMNLRVVNSDDIFEYLLTKGGLGLDMANMSDEDYIKSQEIRARAKSLSSKRMDLLLRGRIGLVIDGTGKDFNKIKKTSEMLKELGYETAMIFVNTTLEISLRRNSERARKVDPEIVKQSWYDVQSNIGKFQSYFGRNNFFLVDNSTYDNKDAIKETYKHILSFVKSPVKNPIAKQWIQNELDAKRREEFKNLKFQLQEILNRYDVGNWNNIQKNIWIRLVQDNIVQMNDMKKFFWFGQLFSDYFDKYGKPAPYDYIVQNI